jgi:hypothetical protein
VAGLAASVLPWGHTVTLRQDSRGEPCPTVVPLRPPAYGLMMQPDTLPGLLERFGLRMGQPLGGGWTPPAR